VEVVNSIVNKCKEKYGDRFEYYLTGSYARNESGYKDYDIAIYDNRNESNDWESLLKMFFNKKEKDGKNIDTQIDQMTRVIKRMSGQILHENRNERVKRYVYSDEKLKDWKYIKYNNLYGNLWEKEIMLVKPKHKAMGLDKIKRIYIKI
jgi:predicted nucleotidyltransferase